MNRSSFALFVALLLHLVIILIFMGLGTLMPEIKKVAPVEKKIKISLRELPKPVKKVQKKSKKQKEAIKKTKIAPPMPKGKQLKKIIKKPPLAFKPKLKPKKPQSKPKPKTKPKIKKVTPLLPEKPYIPLSPKKVKVKKAPKKKAPAEMDWLMEDKSAEIKPEDTIEKMRGASAVKNIKELYGVDFAKLSKAQQEYILDNQEIMRRITQTVLNRQASVTNINGLNVNRNNIIEFYLHPNGDMSDFKFLKQSGYVVLDGITRATIEFAYSKYPRPTERTLIRYKVFYNLTKY